MSEAERSPEQLDGGQLVVVGAGRSEGPGTRERSDMSTLGER